MEAADFAFVGTAQAVIEPMVEDGIISSGDFFGYVFRVELAWKGVSADTITIWTPRSGSNCGYHIQLGERYFMLAQTRRGRPLTGMCSGNERLNNALAARYLLPEPTVIAPGATWPALSRDDLLDILCKGNEQASYLAASLLAGDLLLHRRGGPSVVRLLTVAPTEAARIMATAPDSIAATAALAALARRLLDDDSAWTRAAAIEGLGALADGKELEPVIRRGFADPEEVVRGAARQVMIGRRADLEAAAEVVCVSDFIASVAAMPGSGRWMGVHQLRYFPAQRDLIRPFLEAMADTVTEKMLLKTTREVLKELSAD